MRKELEVEIATVIAKTAGFPPAAKAIEMASGTSRTVAPTFDIIKVKIVASTASTACKLQIGQPSSSSSTRSRPFAVAAASRRDERRDERRAERDGSRKIVYIYRIVVCAPDSSLASCGGSGTAFACLYVTSVRETDRPCLEA